MIRMAFAKRFTSNQSGAVAIEFAIVSTIMITVMLGVVEFGRGLNVRNQLAQAADAGTRHLLVNSALPNADLEARLRAAFFAADPKDLSITLAEETVGDLKFRRIDMSYPFTPLVPNLLNSAITVSLSRRVPLS
jgi:Flp pilus assembly protein TadG